MLIQQFGYKGGLGWLQRASQTVQSLPPFLVALYWSCGMRRVGRAASFGGATGHKLGGSTRPRLRKRNRATIGGLCLFVKTRKRPYINRVKIG